MESHRKEGETPVSENLSDPEDPLSSTAHVKRGVNLPRPRGKAKYSLATDSEPVPRGKGEKNPSEGSEIEPEMMCLQGVGAGAIEGLREIEISD